MSSGEQRNRLLRRLWDGAALASLVTAAMGCHVLPTFANGADAPRPYVADALTRDLGLGRVRTIGCLDVGIGINDGPRPSDDWLLDIDVGNRCGTQATLDLGNVSLEAFGPTGVRVGTWLLDPRAEVRAVRVAGAGLGHERIRLASSLPRERIAILCADLSRVVPDPDHTRQPICFVRSAEGWRFRDESGS